MIQVDISGVWGEISLPDLLAIEKETADAHAALPERVPFPEQEMGRLLQAAQAIRTDSEVCVVVGAGEGPLAARAAMELLQGPNRNWNRKPRIFFAGNSFSTRQWNELVGLLEGKDFSVIVVSPSGEDLEYAIAFRGLRWMLERRYGTEEAGQRIYVVTHPENGSLCRMAAEAGWQQFPLPAAGLLPMAVAGIDVEEVRKGAQQAREEYDLRSFENPVWLYAAVRNVLLRRGKNVELLKTLEPGFHSFGLWWQRLLDNGILPVPGDGIRQGDFFETVLRFDPPEKPYVIGSDWKNLDGLNYLEGKTLDFVEEQARQAAVEAQMDRGVPVIAMDCGELNEGRVGELFCFLALCRGISAGILGVDPAHTEGPDRDNLFRLLGRPESEKSSADFTK